MKITKSKLKQLIKEELLAIREGLDVYGPDPNVRYKEAVEELKAALKAKASSPYANIAQKKLANLALPDGSFNPDNAGGYGESDAISMLHSAIDKL